MPPAQTLGWSSGPNSAYAVATDGGDGPGYVDSPVGAWSVTLENVPGETPDPMREGQMPVRDYRPDPKFNPEYFWLGPRGPGTERYERHQVEYLDGDGFGVPAPTRWPMGPDPRWIPPEEPRVTDRLSPSTYRFTRPFDQTIARHYNGDHFSMADHRRQYPIMGMNPPPFRRNTYRADPIPWDTFRVDMPQPAVNVSDSGQIVAFDLPPSGAQSWRL